MQKNTCAFCDSTKLTEIIDFGDVALAGSFINKDQISDEKKYPLAIVFCEDCYVVQVKDHIDPSVLFANDFYFSSAIKTLRDHFKSYAEEVVERFIENPAEATTVEFGSNDGVLLRPVSDQGVGTVIGVDPATNIVNSIETEDLVLINDFFNVPVAKKIVEEHGNADLVMANNTYAHITDINGTTEAITTVLNDDGVFIFEVHYLGKVIEDMQYDMIYHEHTYYYSLLALQNHMERHGMVIFDLKHVPTHAGSIRFYATKKDSKHAANISSNVTDLQEEELRLGYDKIDAYKEFADRVAGTKKDLMKLLGELKADGKTIVGYGASGRANTTIQYCGITDEHLDYMIDDAPAKQGMYTPGSHLEIKSSDALGTDKPDFVLLFAWAFYKEIVSKNQDFVDGGGHVIVPLPKVEITTK